MVLLNLLISTGGTLLVFTLYKIFEFFYAQFTSPLRDLPGPRSPSFLYGNFKEIWHAVRAPLLNCSSFELVAMSLTLSCWGFVQENSVLHEKWVQEYGSTVVYKGIANVEFRTLCSTHYVDLFSLFFFFLFRVCVCVCI